MSFALYGLLGKDSPPLSNESLAADLQNFFRAEAGFRLEFEKLPFAKSKTLALRWDDWLVRVSYEEGVAVEEDSREIMRMMGASAPTDLSAVNRRIRVVFGDDDEQRYTNETIYVMDFLRAIKGIVIFDPQQKDFIR